MPHATTMLHQFATILADVLVPGDDAFPRASEAGVVATFVKRLTELRGGRHLETVSVTLSQRRLFIDMSDKERADALSTFEVEQRPLFEELLAVLYLSYYESPLVTAAIEGLGLTYHNPPQPHGYRMSGFNADDPLEYPRHGRGSYVPTDQVRRVSLEGLDHLDEAVRNR